MLQSLITLIITHSSHFSSWLITYLLFLSVCLGSCSLQPVRVLRHVQSCDLEKHNFPASLLVWISGKVLEVNKCQVPGDSYCPGTIQLFTVWSRIEQVSSPSEEGKAILERPGSHLCWEKRSSSIKAANLPTIEALTSVQVYSSLVQEMDREMDRPDGIYTAALYQYDRFCSSKNAVCLTVIVAENVFNVDLSLQSSVHRAQWCLHQRGAAEQSAESSGTQADLTSPCFPEPEEVISSQKKPMD